MPARLAAPFAAVLFVAALATGCGSSSDDSTRSERNAAPPPSSSGAPVGASARSCDSYASDATALRATNVSCGQARQVMFGWQRQGSCSTRAGASRSSCLSRSYRCLATRTDRGIAVSCARAGRSIAFIAKRD
jgi:hypothetical protein